MGGKKALTGVDILKELERLTQDERIALSAFLDGVAECLVPLLPEIAKQECKLAVLNLIKAGLVEIRDMKDIVVLQPTELGYRVDTSKWEG